MIRIILILLALVGCTANEEPNKNTLTVGTNAEFAPFSFMEGQTIQGFDIDIAQEVVKRLGGEMRLENLPFDALIPALQLGSVDFIAAGMSITEERQKVVDFSLPYVDAEPLCAISLKEMGDLKTERIVVNEGYTADYWVTDILQNEPLRLNNPMDALLALESNRADVFITAKNTLPPLLRAHPEMELFEIPETGDNCALMFRKGSDDLREKINQTLQEMAEDGTIQQLKEKWGLA